MTNTGESSSGWHRLASLIECPRKFGYQYKEGLEPIIPKRALSLGTAVHEGLTTYYEGDQRGWYEHIREQTNEGVSWRFMASEAANIIPIVLKENLISLESVLDVEREIKISIGGLDFSRRIDLIIDSPNGIYFVDHKTASNPTTRMKNVRYEPAIMSQSLVGLEKSYELYGRHFAGTLIHLIGTRKPYSVSLERTHYSSKDLGELKLSIRYWLKKADAYMNSPLSFWDYPKSYNCMGRYGPCDYLSLCNLGEVALDDYKRKGEESNERIDCSIWGIRHR